MTAESPESKDLATSAARGASVTLAGQVARLLIQLVGVIVLSRLLLPSDFGIVAMVAAFIGLGEILRDFGLGSAAVQARTLTHQQRDNLFWINTALGLLMGILIAVAAPYIAEFYSEPRLVAVTQVLAVGLLLNGMTAQYRANLSRHLKFAHVTISDVAPAFLALVTAAVLSFMGWGYWALVGQQLTQALLGLILAAAFGRWVPGLPRRTPGMRELITYGVNLFGVAILNYVTRNVDSVVVGARFGATNLGLYNRAYELVTHSINRINMPLTRVAVSVLSRLQDQPARHGDFLLLGQKVLLHITLPLLGIGAALAYQLVIVVLGVNWIGSAPIVQILVVGAAADVAGYATYWFALSKGRTAAYLHINLVTAPVKISLILVGSIWGTMGVAAGFATGSIVLWIVALLWLGKSAAAPSMKLFTSALRALSVNVIAAVGAFSATLLVVPGGEWAQIAVGLAAYLVLWATGVGCLRPVRRDVLEVVGARRYFRNSSESRS
ncbi:lipopolysaccharide biosynthesis protein [Microbacterium trichothecenolyticum]|uniref:lipopolysaccharide biosynthesis protein n=1 Tax=Microbacterium trichothecenolyticum TaxID=69370 RepID=UPI0035BE7774